MKFGLTPAQRKEFAGRASHEARGLKYPFGMSVKQGRESCLPRGTRIEIEHLGKQVAAVDVVPPTRHED